MKNRMVGDLEISRVHELFLRVPTGDFFPDTPVEAWEPHKDWLIAEKALNAAGTEIVLPVQSYVVRTSHHNILIDTCVGNDKNRPHRDGWHMKTDDTYMKSLAAVGLKPEDIDYVMCTHLHHDHVGWNTKLVDGRWVPTFPNAKYLMSKKELDIFKGQEDPAASLSLIDSVLPVVDSGNRLSPTTMRSTTKSGLSHTGSRRMFPVAFNRSRRRWRQSDRVRKCMHQLARPFRSANGRRGGGF